MGIMIERKKKLLMMQIAEPTPEGVGIFTRGYEAILTPEGTNSFTITHNLGIIPRLCVIEAVMDTVTGTNYPIEAIIDFDMYDIKGDKTGSCAYMYHYNGSDSFNAYHLPDSRIPTVNETTISLKALYSTIRSPWDTSATYIVRVWG